MFIASNYNMLYYTLIDIQYAVCETRPEIVSEGNSSKGAQKIEAKGENGTVAIQRATPFYRPCPRGIVACWIA